MSYTEPLDKYGDLIAKSTFINDCDSDFFNDFDGFGYPVKNDLVDTSKRIYPSMIHKIPEDATHIIWYNK